MITTKIGLRTNSSGWRNLMTRQCMLEILSFKSGWDRCMERV